MPQELIYSEPFIRFDKNPSTNEFESIIQIKNTSASVYVSDYVVGIRNNTDKVDLWNDFTFFRSFKSHKHDFRFY